MRKNLLSDLVGAEDELTPVNSKPVRANKPAPLGSQGVVGAFKRSFAELTAERAAPAGQQVVEIQTDLIDRSIAQDRMAGPQAEHELLVQSIRQHGQQVPVLLRPHPDGSERFQIAYGHRRVEAARALAIPVRAVVRPLSDAELVVAQGQENSARKDLSFIERATFGARLEDLKFGRDTVMAALSIDKTELSRLIAVARGISPEIIEAIGPAPKAGRLRWMGLAKLLEQKSGLKGAAQAIDADGFSDLDSDARFARVLAAATPKAASAPKARTWRGEGGNIRAKISRQGSMVTLAIDHNPEFGEFVANNLDDLYRKFRSEAEGQPDE